MSHLQNLINERTNLKTNELTRIAKMKVEYLNKVDILFGQSFIEAYYSNNLDSIKVVPYKNETILIFPFNYYHNLYHIYVQVSKNNDVKYELRCGSSSCIVSNTKELIAGIRKAHKKQKSYTFKKRYGFNYFLDEYILTKRNKSKKIKKEGMFLLSKLESLLGEEVYNDVYDSADAVYAFETPYKKFMVKILLSYRGIQYDIVISEDSFFINDFNYSFHNLNEFLDFFADRDIEYGK